MTTIVGAFTAALIAAAPGINGFFTQNGRYFVSEHAVGGGMGESLTEASVTDLWTGKTETLEPMLRQMNCALFGDTLAESEVDTDAEERALAKCRDGNRASEAAYEEKLSRWRDAAAPGNPSLTSRSGTAKFEVLAAEGSAPVELEQSNPPVIDGPAHAAALIRLAVPGRPVREFRHEFHDGDDRKETLFMVWSADGQWVGFEQPGSLHAQAYPAIAMVDVLDSGAGAKLPALLEKLEKAGYKASHQGKAKASRKASEIFYLPGFLEDGRLVAKALGLPEESVKPITWPSRYAVTVAAGTD